MDAFDFASMIDETPVNSSVIEYLAPSRVPGGEKRLIGACLTDILTDGVSMVYSFFDPSEEPRSLGAYMILDHIQMASEMGLDYVYLGYWVSGSPQDGLQDRLQALRALRRHALDPLPVHRGLPRMEPRAPCAPCSTPDHRLSRDRARVRFR